MKYLLKVDLSGIQDFIFNVPSKGASRNLKGRSFFMQSVTEIAEKYFGDFTGGKEVLYNGGGNLFLYINSTKDVLDNAIQQFQNCFHQQSIFPFMAYVEAEEDELFSEKMRLLNQKISRQKWKRPVSFDVVTPENANTFDEKYKAFTQKMITAKGYNIEKNEKVVFKITENSFDIAGYSLTLQHEGHLQFSFQDLVINAMPVKDGETLDFDKIAEKAKERKVDDKLAALKMDVDNLGVLFRGKDKEQYQKLSKGIHIFFERELYSTVLKESIDVGNLYPVFAGGDDCFLIGAWDVVLPLAYQVHERFNHFQQGLKQNGLIRKDITLSAGIVITNPSYPLTRMAAEVEHALELAKEHGKNRISIFGEVLQWAEFANAESLAHTLKELIDNGESRAILERIRSSEIGFRSLQHRAVNHGNIDFPKVYRLKYYLRNAKKAENRKVMEEAFEKYAKALLDDFINKRKISNAAQFPVAARWAELLTKTSNS